MIAQETGAMLTHLGLLASVSECCDLGLGMPPKLTSLAC